MSREKGVDWGMSGIGARGGRRRVKYGQGEAWGGGWKEDSLRGRIEWTTLLLSAFFCHNSSYKIH